MREKQRWHDGFSSVRLCRVSKGYGMSLIGRERERERDILRRADVLVLCYCPDAYLMLCVCSLVAILENQVVVVVEVWKKKKKITEVVAVWQCLPLSLYKAASCLLPSSNTQGIELHSSFHKLTWQKRSHTASLPVLALDSLA